MNVNRTSLVLMSIASLFVAGRATADFTFGEPVNLKTVIPAIDPVHESIDCFSSDGLEIYIESDRSGGQGNYDLWVLRRDSTSEDWGPPQNLGAAVNSPQVDGAVVISGDGLTLYFGSNRPGGQGDFDVYTTTRATKSAPWGPAMNLGPKVNSSAPEGCPWISANGLELYVNAYERPGGYGKNDIYVTRRATTDDPWGEPVNLGPIVNTPYNDSIPSLSPDGLLLLFSDNFENNAVPRPGGYGGSDMWMTRRASDSSLWEAPVNLGPQVNRSIHEAIARISPDGSMLIFTTNSAGIWDNWQAPIIPVVDFDGDGRVDGKDVLIMADCWGQDEPLCDIGPSAWGNGTVDVNDLIVLAEHIGEEVVDPTLIALWKLDETQGSTAHNSVDGNEAPVMGSPAWEPDGGKIDGALACDGVNDFVPTRFVLNPGAGPFSVTAWVKGGAPGQVVISQAGGADWLCANPSDGTLMTSLMSPSRFAKPGVSNVVITDGPWHRVGLVWDGANRILFVDDEEVARDAQPMLADCPGMLVVGGGKSLSSGSFWSGLIDEVRVYNRVVKP